MKTFATLTVGTLMLGSMSVLACSKGNPSDQLVGTTAAAEKRDNEKCDNDRPKSADSSPYVIGAWRFVPNPSGVDQTPLVDTEFRFINPTDTDLTIEYAFFDLSGATFCGCDRDDFPPNHTTIYTMQAEATGPNTGGNPKFPNLFNLSVCPGITSGALKAIAFKVKGKRIVLDDGLQVGFQTTAFAGVNEGSNLLTGTVMTESNLLGIGINEATEREIEDIHEQCTNALPPM
jgi:hypothetical protein